MAVALLFAVMAFFYKYVDLSKRLQATNLSDDGQDESSSLVFDRQIPGSGERKRVNYSTESGNGNVLQEEEEKNPPESKL